MRCNPYAVTWRQVKRLIGENKLALPELILHLKRPLRCQLSCFGSDSWRCFYAVLGTYWVSVLERGSASPTRLSKVLACCAARRRCHVRRGPAPHCTTRPAPNLSSATGAQSPGRTRPPAVADLNAGTLAESVQQAGRRMATAFRERRWRHGGRIPEADVADPTCGLRAGLADVALATRMLRSDPRPAQPDRFAGGG